MCLVLGVSAAAVYFFPPEHKHEGKLLIIIFSPLKLVPLLPPYPPSFPFALCCTNYWYFRSSNGNGVSSVQKKKGRKRGKSPYKHTHTQLIIQILTKHTRCWCMRAESGDLVRPLLDLASGRGEGQVENTLTRLGNPSLGMQGFRQVRTAVQT